MTVNKLESQEKYVYIVNCQQPVLALHLNKFIDYTLKNI